MKIFMDELSGVMDIFFPVLIGVVFWFLMEGDMFYLYRGIWTFSNQ
jgi:hypothetical protein